jgi:uncharacterized protein
MSWIVIGQENGKIKLISKSSMTGLLPKGSYLTVESGEAKYILRVDESIQFDPFSPSPLIIDMDLSGLKQDQKCQNIVLAYRVKDIALRNDGLIDFIKPQSKARRSNQEEVLKAMGDIQKGPSIFLGTVYSGHNQILTDDENNLMQAKLPEDMFFHQMLICGKTGSGKTVGTKYLAQYFVEELKGAVLAINVKDVDFLQMDSASKPLNFDVSKEWKSLGISPHKVENFNIYYPANTDIRQTKNINYDVCQKITLNVHEIEPESLTGLLHNISDIGAQNFPNIFRFWQSLRMENNSTFTNFVQYFNNAANDKRTFQTMNTRGDISEITLHRGTYDSIQRNLDSAVDFFDNKNALNISEKDILQKGTLSVINVTGNKGTKFGSIVLRHLLHKIVDAKSNKRSDIPVLIIIDEVHQFYKDDAAEEALGDLDTICRTGRSQKIGVIFSSQNPNDIPRGLNSVINTKIFFKTDNHIARQFGLSNDEIESLDKGYAVANIHDLSQLKILKFPLAFAGVL